MAGDLATTIMKLFPGLPPEVAQLFMGGSESSGLDIQKLFAANALQQQMNQQRYQPVNEQLIGAKIGQLGQPGFNPYGTAPSARPGQTTGSTPGAGPGLQGAPDLSDLAQRLGLIFRNQTSSNPFVPVGPKPPKQGDPEQPIGFK